MNLKMPEALKIHYLNELDTYRHAFKTGDLAASWRSLERSHVLGQAFPLEHTYSHWLMMKFGFKTKNLKEVIGQFPRLIFGGMKSFVGVIPVGNTGGANVPPLRSMEIENDLKLILNNSKKH